MRLAWSVSSLIGCVKPPKWGCQWAKALMTARSSTFEDVIVAFCWEEGSRVVSDGVEFGF